MKTRDPETAFNINWDPYIEESLASMEGIPGMRGSLPAGKARSYHVFDWAAMVIPGLALAYAISLLGGWLSVLIGRELFGFEQSPFSPILMTVLVGLLIRNLIGLPAGFEGGLKLCVKQLLRIGVALLGVQLSLAAVGAIGIRAIPVIVVCISVALVSVHWLSRILGVSSRLGCLIGVGTSICGISAVMAVAPAIGAKDDEIGYSVGIITLFGMMALLGYPFLAHFFFAGDARLAGYFLGTAIHDTSQVAGAGLMYEMRYASPEGLEVATTTKLIRNLFMGLVLPLMAVAYHGRGGGVAVRMKWNRVLPFFILGFMAFVCMRTVGDILVGSESFKSLNPASWAKLLESAKQVSVLCLSLAMAAVGLGTPLGQFRKLGLRPLMMGLLVALLVGFSSVAGIWVIS